MKKHIVGLFRENHTFFLPYALFLLAGACLLFIYPTGQLVQIFAERRTPATDLFFQYITKAGEAIPFFIAITWFSIKKQYRKSLLIGLTGIIATITSFLLKQFFAQPRPSLFFQEKNFSLTPVHGIDLHTGLTSFPSGHTTAAFALFSLLAFFSQSKKYGTLFFIIATLVGISRIYLGQHFLKDIYAGSLLGTLSAAIIYLLFKKNTTIKKQHIATLLLCITTATTPAQTKKNTSIDTLLYLPPITLCEPVFSASLIAGENTERQHIRADATDSLLNSSYHIGSLLAGRAAVKLRTYAPGMLSTLSLRGSGAQHLLTVWNGMPIKNAMNGTTDLSLLPSALLGQTQLIVGGGSADDGPGAIGGVLLINDQLQFPQKTPLSISTQTQIGSFQRLEQGIHAYYTGSNNGAGLRWYLAKAQNNYPWKVEGQQGQQENNSYRIQGLSAFYQHYTNNTGRISIHLWAQDAFRQIPPSRSEINTHATQSDRHLRWVTDWQKQIKHNLLIGLKAGSNREQLIYQSDLIPPGPDTSHTFMLEARMAGQLKKTSSFLAFRQMWERAWSDNISDSNYAIRTSQSLQIAAKKQINKLLISGGSCHLQRTDGEINPPTASVYLNFQHGKWNSRLRLTQNYNLPTFNDLYWNGGYATGNPGLKPELARGSEWMLKWKTKKLELWQLSSISLTKNLILWQFDNTVWTPENIRTVLSPGINAGLHISLGYWNIRTEADYQAPRILENQNTNNSYKGKRLPYYPFWKSTTTLSLKKQHLHIALLHSYTGKRFTTTDNKKLLPGFHQLDLAASYTTNINEATLQWRFQLLNLLNQNNEFFPFRPLPGRQWSISVLINNQTS